MEKGQEGGPRTAAAPHSRMEEAEMRRADCLCCCLVRGPE